MSWGPVLGAFLAVQAKCGVANEAELQGRRALQRFADCSLVVVGVVAVPSVGYGAARHTAWGAACGQRVAFVEMSPVAGSRTHDVLGATP